MKKRLSDMSPAEKAQLTANWAVTAAELPLSTGRHLTVLPENNGPAPGVLVPHHLRLEITNSRGRKVDARIFLRFPINPLGQPFGAAMVKIAFLAVYRSDLSHPGLLLEREYPDFDLETVLAEIGEAFIKAGLVKKAKQPGASHFFYSAKERPALPPKPAQKEDYGKMVDDIHAEAVFAYHSRQGVGKHIKRSDAVGRSTYTE